MMPPQDLEQARHAVDLVKDHQLVALGAQKGIGIVQAESVGRPLQVQVDRALRPGLGQRQSQGGLAHLARPEQDHRGRLLQARRQGGA